MKRMSSTASLIVLFLLIISGLERLQVSAHYLGILAPKREVVRQIPQPNKPQLQGNLRGRQILEALRINVGAAAARHNSGKGSGSRGGGPGLVRPKSKENGASPRLALSPFANNILVQVTVSVLLLQLVFF